MTPLYTKRDQFNRIVTGDCRATVLAAYPDLHPSSTVFVVVFTADVSAALRARAIPRTLDNGPLLTARKTPRGPALPGRVKR